MGVSLEIYRAAIGLFNGKIFSISKVFRLDRSNGRRAGGVALYISSSLVAKRRLDLEKVGIELLWVEI
jgi:hypothetical protein